MDKIIASNGFNIDSIRVQIEQEVSNLLEYDILILLDNLATVKFVNSTSFYVFLLQNRKEKFILNKILHQFGDMTNETRDELYPYIIDKIVDQLDGIYYNDKFMAHIIKKNDKEGLHYYIMSIKPIQYREFVKFIIKSHYACSNSNIKYEDMLNAIPVGYNATEDIISYIKNNTLPNKIIAMLLINYCKEIKEYDILELGFHMKHRPDILELLKSLLSNLVKEDSIYCDILYAHNKFGLEYLSYMYNYNIFEHLSEDALKYYLVSRYTINPDDVIIQYIKDNNMHYLFQESGLTKRLIACKQYNSLRVLEV